MGFGFFKKKEEVPENESLAYADLPTWLEEKTKSLDEEERELLNSITTTATSTIETLSTKTPLLTNIDLSKKKADERAKSIVLTQAKAYANQVTTLIDSLASVEETKGKTAITSFQSILEDFQKRSGGSYDKANYLIGRELVDLRDAAAGFNHNLQQLKTQHEPLFDELNYLEEINKHLEEQKTISEGIKEVEHNITRLKKQVDLNRSGRVQEESALSSHKESEEYQHAQNVRNAIKEKVAEREKALQSLKTTLDWKELARIYHGSQNDWEIFKEHRDDFSNAYLKDNGETLTRLLRDARQLEPHSNQIKSIEEITLQIENSPVFDDGTTKFESNIQTLEQEAERIEDDLDKENKRLKTLNEKHDNYKQEIISILEALHVNVV